MTFSKSGPETKKPAAEDDGADDDSSSSGSSGDIFSDDEDVFQLQEVSPELLPDAYKNSFLERRRRATLALVDELRNEPLLPLDPSNEERVFVDLDSGILLPSWHCPFDGCSACGVVRHDKVEAAIGSRCILSQSNHAAELWVHVGGLHAENRRGT